MKIKKYRAKSAHEAMIELKRELGPDAVILNTKTVRASGVFGFLKKPLVEITAAYEEVEDKDTSNDQEYNKELKEINRELLELKAILKEDVIKEYPNYIEKSEETIVKYPESLQILKENLLSNGVYEDIIDKIFFDICNKIDIDQKTEEEVKEIVKYHLSEQLGNPQPITLDKSQEKIFFIGPTGVGKTTTLAKVAASLVLEDRYKVGLITSDTYRIGAVDQLKIYGDILDLPLKVSYNKKDMDQAFEQFKEKDILLIDTAGRNHNDSEQIDELRKVLETTTDREVYLLVNATIDRKLLKNIINKYNFVDDYKIIITKLDEAESFGSIFNIRFITGKDISYYTNGQSVPDDIKVFNKDFVVEKLIERGN